ncbi:MAG: hypothetical protein RLZ02_1417 [Actinomycetota bacterium]
MAKQCERPGCKEPAIAAYFLDSAELLMTLENYVPVDGMQVNGLCRRHADALVVPRGWRIEDKRENVPRLFPVTPPSEKPKTKGATPKKSEPKKNRTKLPRPSIFDELKNDKKVEEVVAPVVEVVSEDDVELEETKAIPWSPQFDHTDDLGGVLRPKGRLLSRAFNFDDTNADGLEREPFDENDIP